MRENDTTARPRAPEGRPGALQGHHRGSNEARSHTHAGGVWRSSGTALPTAGRAARGATRQEGEASASAVSEDQWPHQTPQGRGRETEGQGRRPHPNTPAFLTLPKGQGGKTGGGTRGQTEKSGHVHWERPSLVRHGLGPARESTTTPHRSVEPKRGRGAWGRAQARTATRGAPL